MTYLVENISTIAGVWLSLIIGFLIVGFSINRARKKRSNESGRYIAQAIHGFAQEMKRTPFVCREVLGRKLNVKSWTLESDLYVASWTRALGTDHVQTGTVTVYRKGSTDASWTLGVLRARVVHIAFTSGDAHHVIDVEGFQDFPITQQLANCIFDEWTLTVLATAAARC
ncbi:MAG: hypothetical protein KBE09_02485 [Candidatus Pacebacteria bacterium]|nr:hypothetical protein [Candidatus Paceibacterota bacterium]